MEIHPPTHPIHNWREFLTHMSIIVLGLLIAVGLEQSVEALHRLHERKKLEREYREEARDNVAILETRLLADTTKVKSEQQLADLLLQAKPSGGFIFFTVPRDPHPEITSLRTHLSSSSVWSVARSAGTLALLPSQEAQLFDRIEMEASMAVEASWQFERDLLEVNRESQRKNVPNLVEGKTLRLTPAQRDALADSFRAIVILRTHVDQRLVDWLGADEALLGGAAKMEDIYPYIDRAGNKWNP